MSESKQQAQLDWLIAKTCEGYLSLRTIEGEHGPSPDAALEVAKSLACTVFIEAAKAPKARAVKGHAKQPYPGESEKESFTLPQRVGDVSLKEWQEAQPEGQAPPTGDYVPKPVNRSSYCDCDHDCWKAFSEDYDGCACEPGACLNQYGKACGCIKPLPTTRGKVRMVPDRQNEGRWRWVEIAS